MTRNMKILFVVLGLSLALNVFALGHVIGRGLPPKHHSDRPPMGPIEFNLRAIHKLLPEEARGQLKDALRENRSMMRESYKAFREDQRTLKALLTAETFDVAAFEAALNQHDDAMRAMHGPMREALLKILPTLDQPTRAALADAFFSRPRMPKKMKFKDDRDDDMPPPPPGDEPGPGPEDGPPED
ncbi:periplasmic heavy metal sensor [Gimibacter soli]|uniref:Periplasmic heavy metal sensor n=1 Tax=Gimibacter soli TaxID=3024400 RepID=A0AAF0BHR8_9PROT|nr:periplasmic heavy metal sensor [Gimibacter soli]WCL54553.1 periplasmic heavy metal sensor [Gimibacter soli]